jgi:hypothetical protein
MARALPVPASLMLLADVVDRLLGEGGLMQKVNR